MTSSLDRRRFLQYSAAGRWAGLALTLASQDSVSARPTSRRCSRSRWPNGRCTRPCSAARSKNLDFAQSAKTEYGIDAVEYVNQFFKDKAKDQKYLEPN